MTRRVILRGVLLALTMLLSLSACRDQAVDWEQLDRAVIRVVAIDKARPGHFNALSSGSAFAINGQGYFISNHHVVENAMQAQVELVAVEAIVPEPKLHRVDIVWSSAEQDLAILKIDSLHLPPLPLTKAADVVKNQEVVSIGFPGASDNSPENPAFIDPKIKRGVISARQLFPLTSGGRAIALFEHDATVNTGNSGGPLLDACGRVVGVNVAKARSGIHAVDVSGGRAPNQIGLDINEGTFFSIQSDELIQALRSHRIDFSLDHSLCKPMASDHQGLIAIVVVLALLLAVTLRQQRKHSPAIVDSHVLSEWYRKKWGEKMPSGHPAGFIKRDSKGFPKPQPLPNPTVAIVLHPEKKQWPVLTLQPGVIYKLGRDPNQVSFVIEQTDVSRCHAQLRWHERRGLRVMDLDSTNGVFVDHVKLANRAWTTIKPGQRLIFGSEQVVYRMADD